MIYKEILTGRKGVKVWQPVFFSSESKKIGKIPRECLTIYIVCQTLPVRLPNMKNHGNKMKDNYFSNDLYERFVENFIDYLKEKLDDKFWLMTNHILIEDMFHALSESEEIDGLLPAIRIFEEEPGFAAILDEITLKLLNEQEMAA